MVAAVSGPPPSAVVQTVNEDPDGDGISGDRDNCPYDYNPDQEDGWGSKMGDVCDTEWYNTNGMGVSGFEGKDDMYQVFANCYPMYDGDTRCHLVGRFDPTTLSPDSAPMDVTNCGSRMAGR